MISEKKRSTALLLCLVLGFFGAHRFYLDKRRTAIVQFATLGLGGIWTAIDFFYIACGNFKDKEGKFVKAW